MDKKFVILAVSLMVAANPVLAQDLSPVVTVIQTVIDAVTGPIARGVSILAIAGVAFAMMYGRMQVTLGMIVLFGIALLFGAQTFVDGFAAP